MKSLTSTLRICRKKLHAHLYFLIFSLSPSFMLTVLSPFSCCKTKTRFHSLTLWSVSSSSSSTSFFNPLTCTCFSLSLPVSLILLLFVFLSLSIIPLSLYLCSNPCSGVHPHAPTLTRKDGRVCVCVCGQHCSPIATDRVTSAGKNALSFCSFSDSLLFPEPLPSNTRTHTLDD